MPFLFHAEILTINKLMQKGSMVNIIILMDNQACQEDNMNPVQSSDFITKSDKLSIVTVKIEPNLD